MLLREAVTNIVRHARAREVWISIAPVGGGHRLTVRDDGVGGLAPEGSGLTGMRERLRAIGGTLERRGEGERRSRRSFRRRRGRARANWCGHDPRAAG
ncbi:ATP-binding protein [Deinococcus radiopugnans]|uniref:ATP-binding protein n=1 Tax=Deinococcus radiopugnans TaxID=57497 RepID=UPI00361ADDD4